MVESRQPFADVMVALRAVFPIFNSYISLSQSVASSSTKLDDIVEVVECLKHWRNRVRRRHSDELEEVRR